MTELEDIRRRWLERLGIPVVLDFPLAAIENVFPVSDGVSIATVEVYAGTISTTDQLEAVGLHAVPVPAEVVRIDSPVTERRDVAEVAFATAGSVVGLHMVHDPSRSLEAGQCLAPAGRLALAQKFVADVWCLPSEDLPGTEQEQRALCDAIGDGRGLELFVHTRAVPARARAPWRPTLGGESVITFDLDAPVAIYPGTRFGLCYEGLTFGAGFVRGGA